MAPIGKFSGVIKTGFSRLDNVLAANIGGVDNTTLVLGPPPGTIITNHKKYQFNSERGLRSLWRPSNPIGSTETAINLNETAAGGQFSPFDDQSAWVNGIPEDIEEGGDVIFLNSGVQTWNNLPIKDWSISFRNANDIRDEAGQFKGATPSSFTGPGADVNRNINAGEPGTQSTLFPSGQQDGNTSGGVFINKFLFTEASGNSNKTFVTRLLFCNAAGNGGFMSDPVSNQLQLGLYLHSRGTDMGKFQVWGAVGNTLSTMLNANNTGTGTNAEANLTNTNQNLSTTQPGITACGKLFDRDLSDFALDANEAGMNADYEYIQVNLNLLKEAERNNTDDHTHDFGLVYCIYFIHTDLTSWKGDLAMDYVSILETT